MIYFLLDGGDADVDRDAIAAELETWLTESRSSAELINSEDPSGELDWLLGLQIDSKRPKTIAKPMQQLYAIAVAHELECVVGQYGDDGEREDVCYFGFEEGKPNIDEVMMYLSL
jgi:hypothetical protein